MLAPKRLTRIRQARHGERICVEHLHFSFPPVIHLFAFAGALSVVKVLTKIWKARQVLKAGTMLYVIEIATANNISALPHLSVECSPGKFEDGNHFCEDCPREFCHRVRLLLNIEKRPSCNVLLVLSGKVSERFRQKYLQRLSAWHIQCKPWPARGNSLHSHV